MHAEGERHFASLRLTTSVSAGPRKEGLRLFCFVGGNCKVRLSVLNPREEDRIAALRECGASGDSLILGVSVPGAVVEEGLQEFSWEHRVVASADQMRDGLELCWSGRTDGLASEEPSDFSLSFGHLLLRGEEIPRSSTAPELSRLAVGGSDGASPREFSS